MKKLYLLTAMVLITMAGVAQNNQVDPQLTNKTWVDNETRTINGFHVTRIDGTDYGNARNSSFGMITSVAYKKKTGTESGELEFYITRYEQSLANLKWFMIIIRGEDDKDKIFEQKLDYQAPEMPDGNYYWNYTSIKLPDNIHPPFYVYIRDRNIEMLYSAKFLIEE